MKEKIKRVDIKIQFNYNPLVTKRNNSVINYIAIDHILAITE